MTEVDLNSVSFEKAYFSLDVTALAAIVFPEIARKALLAHWDGDFRKSLDLYGRLDWQQFANGSIRDLVRVDSLLLNAKMGHGIGQISIELERAKSPAVKFVCHYALACFFFWVDYRRAKLAILGMAKSAPRVRSRGLMLTVLFLYGHIVANCGGRLRGFLIATFSLKVAQFFERTSRPLDRFATRSIYSCYPYTLLVSNRTKWMKLHLENIALTSIFDPFYSSILCISSLYFYAYTGDLARTELLVDAMLKSNANGKVVRYDTVVKIMGLLPLAIRGFGRIIKEQLADYVRQHEQMDHESLVNTQFYRAAAVISLLSGAKEDSLRFIGRAVQHRQQFATATAWIKFDEKIAVLCTRADIPSIHELDFLKVDRNFSPSREVGNLGFELAALIPDAIINGLTWFDDECASLVGLSLGIGPPVGNQLSGSIPLDISSVQLVLRLSTRIVNYAVASGDRIDSLKKVLAEIEARIRIFANLIEKNRAMGAAIEDASRAVAIAATVQMLAHDVRKPFTILKMGLGMLGRARDPSEVTGVLSRLVPEIDKAVRSVDGMIADVMEIGSTSSELIQEPASVESLIENALGEIFRVYPKSNVEIVYDLKHTSLVHVHVIKVGRVLSNIVGNAVQAIGYNGKIWFRTRENDAQIEFCIGNEGSFIAAENIPKLFEAFFTSGKKGGTGLGLAIAQKVIGDHGGRIWCESSKGGHFPNGIVEFYFTLPITTGRAGTTTAHLPTHSSEISKAFLSLSGKDEAHSNMSIDKDELTLEDEIIASSKQLGRPFRVLVIDDEAIYRSALVQSLSRTKALAEAVTLHEADGSVKALLKLNEYRFDLIVTDVDMGAHSLTGFELVQLMARDLVVPALTCVHSNRIVAADHNMAMECGADAFLPKPMARSHLLKLVLQAEQKSETAKNSNILAESTVGRPEVLVVDDNAFVLSAWEDMLGDDALVYLVDSPEALLAKISEEPDFLSRLCCVITDNSFEGSQGDGIDVGRLVKQNHPSLAVFLSSDGQFSDVDFGGSIDCLIDKNPVPLRSLPVNLA